MRKARIGMLLIVLAVLALSAGVVAGMLASRLPVAGAEPSAPAAHVPLSDELGLNAEQREQMRNIWEGVRSQVENCYNDAQDLQRRRDDAVVAILNDEQKSRFEKISKDYTEKFAALTHQREQTFADAVERTKKILNETQRRKYEQILASRVGRGPTTGPAGLLPPPSIMPMPEKRSN